MIHAREDYNRFQDPALDDPSLLSPGSTPIAEDEPVMLFRAKDKYMPRVLAFYMHLLAFDMVLNNANEMQCTKHLHEHLDKLGECVADHLGLVLEWQKKHGCKTPDM